MNQQTYLTTEELSALIKYDARTIRNRLKDAVLFEGVHYIRPFGGRKILFIREAIERDIGGPVEAAGRDGTWTSNSPAEGQQLTGSTTSRPTTRRKAKDLDLIPMAVGGVCHV
jgi:hypothetical protein